MAGRKPGSVSVEQKVRMEVRNIVLNRLRKEIDPIVDSLIARAKAGDVPAIKEALERSMGKEANSVFVSDKDPLTAILEDIQSKSKSIVTDKE